MRRGLRLLSSVLIVTGVLLVADAVVTVIYGKVSQNQLGGDLTKLDRRPLSPAERGVLKVLHSDQQRIAFLARSMRRHVHEGQAIGRIKIPHIHANYAMVEGTGAASLRKGPGHYSATPLPGMPGTVAPKGCSTCCGGPAGC